MSKRPCNYNLYFKGGRQIILAQLLVDKNPNDNIVGLYTDPVIPKNTNTFYTPNQYTINKDKDGYYMTFKSIKGVDKGTKFKLKTGEKLIISQEQDLEWKKNDLTKQFLKDCLYNKLPNPKLFTKQQFFYALKNIELEKIPKKYLSINNKNKLNKTIQDELDNIA